MPETFQQRRERELRNSVVFDQVERQAEEGRVRAAALTSTHPADVAASLKKRATDLRVTFETASILGDAAIDELRAREAVKVVRAQPTLVSALGDPYVANIAQGDYSEMARLSGAAQRKRTKPTFGETLGYIMFGDAALSDERKTQIQGERSAFYGGLKEVTDLAPSVFKQGAKETLYNTAAGSIAQVTERYNQLLRKVGLNDTDAEYGALALRALADAETRKSDALVPKDANALQKGALAGVRALPGAGVGVGAAVLGGPVAGAAVLGVQTNASSYLRGRASGLSVDDATSFAATDAGLEYVSEYVPFLRMFGEAKMGTSLGKRLVRNLVDEQIGEQFATHTQDLNAWASLPENSDKTFSDYLAERPDAALQTAVATLVASGTINATIGAVGATGSTVRKINRMRDSVEAADTLDTIMDSATKHKMRERDPAAFAEYVAGQTQGTASESVYIPVEALDALLQAEIVEEDTQTFFQQYEEQIIEARLTGGDVVIPTSEIAARLAGTPAWETLKADARLEAGGLSPRELETEGGSVERVLEQRGEEIANAALDSIEANQPAVQVFEEVKAQLVAAGFTEDAATKQASLYAANRETWGARLGMSALDYHRANPVEFQRADLAAPAGDASRVMDQAPMLFRGTVPGEQDVGGKDPVSPNTLDEMWFTSSAENAEFFADGEVQSARLKVSNTLEVSEEETKAAGGPAAFIRALKAKGHDYDSVVFRDIVDGVLPSDVWVVFPEGGTVKGRVNFTGRKTYGEDGNAEYVGEMPPAVYNQASRFDDRFGDQPIAVADRFGDPASLLEHDDWAILTAENPRGEQADEVTNARAMRNLEADLQAMGLVYTPATRKYGQIENSFAVVGITQAEADMLGRKYDQDSVLTRAGLTYQDGSVNAVTGSVDVFDERPDDLFTEIPELGVQFAVGIDFDHKIAPVGDTQTAGWTEARVDQLIAGATENSYAVMMTPDDYLGLALSAKGRQVVGDRVESMPEYGTLDPAKMAEGGPISLTVKPGGQPSDYQKANGILSLNALTMAHDGRHRAMILKRAGVAFMPVAIRADGPLAKGTVLTPQRSHGDQLSPGDTPYTFGDLVELKPENREALLALGSPARVLFQSENPIFYSALARAIETSKQAKAPSSQWKGILVNAPGVKAEELEWSGLLEALDFDPKAVFTREELAAVVEAGGIKIDERELGVPPSEDAVQALIDEHNRELEDQFYEDYDSPYYVAEVDNPVEYDDEGEEVQQETRYAVFVDDQQVSNEDFLREEDAFELEQKFNNIATDDALRRYLDEYGMGRRTAVDQLDEESGTQFKSWSSDSSNDTYRELLLTLPIGEGGNPSRAPSTHWDQPAVVAHVRFMDKEDADGNRVFFVEEVQSDWHQKGRDQGYEQPVDPKVVEAAQAKFDAAVGARMLAEDAWVAAVTDTVRAEKVAELAEAEDQSEDARQLRLALSLIDSADRRERLLGLGRVSSLDVGRDAWEDAQAAGHAENLAGRELDVAKGLITNGGVPNAPFKTSWPALVMKRVIRYAVDGGYDKVAWTTGKQQAERYNLSEAVGALEKMYSEPEEGGPDDLITVSVPQRAAGALHENKLGEIIGAPDAFNRTMLFSPAQLKEAFGANIANQLIAAPVGTVLRDDDLQIGGEGMKAFYDRNLVNITNDIIKKSGVKVGPVFVEGVSVSTAVRDERLRMNEQMQRELRFGVTDERRVQIENAIALNNERIAEEDRSSGVKQNPGFEINYALREKATAGFPLFQKTGKPRGQIAMFSDKMAITLFADADMSTLLHETGHLFVEELARNATRPNAPADVKADWAAMRKWLKQNGHTVKGSAIPREAHELLARGFERYLMEGRAPSRNLESVFGTFRAWLVRIYQTVQSLRSPITPEVREVFDRMLATQDAIDTYRQEQNAGPLFADKPADMTQAEFDAYRESVLGSRDEALARLTKKVMDDVRKRANKTYRSRAKEVRDDVLREMETEPRFVALHLLRTGRWLGDGERATTPTKIDRDWFVSTYGAAALDRLPKGPFLVKKGGDEADFIAELTGFRAGADLIDALFEMGDQQRAMREDGDRRSLFDKEADDRVKAALEMDGTADVLSPERIEEEAQAAVESEQQGNLLSAELRYLSRGTGATPTPYRLARVWAERKVRAGTVQAVASRAAVQQYARAAAKSGRAAEAALIAGDSNEAYRQKQAQMINHALFMEAKLAADKVDTIVARMKRLGKRAAMKSVDQDYMDRVHGLLEGFDFRTKSAKFLKEQQDFAAWAASQAEQGFEVQVPPRLALNGVQYTRASVEELYGLDDAIKGLLHLGKLKQGILDGIDERDFAALIDEMVGNIKELPDRKVTTEINDDDRIGASVLSFLIKIETVADDLDGGDPNGPFNRLLTQRANEMENRRAALRDKVLKPISENYLGLPAAHRRRLEERITIPQFLHKGGELDPRNGQPVTMTRMGLLSVALNTGNLSNLEKMSKGEGWDAGDILTVLRAELKKEDWDFVQSVWDAIGLLWPDIAATERALSGVVPEQVEVTPIDTPFGTYRGGYYPVAYDPARSQFAENNSVNEANDLFGMKSGVNTPKGHTITRTEASGPILRSVEAVLFGHVEKVITRIAYAEYTRDVLRVMNNNRVRSAIDLKLGREYRKQIRPWLQRVVNAASVDQRGLNWAERFLRAARVNMSLVAMGFRVSTGIAQIGGWNQSAGRIGPRYLALGMKTLLKGRGDAVQFAFDRSPEMERRNNEVNRDVADAMKLMRGKGGVVNKARAAAFWHIGMIDRYVVALPTWLGAHAKAIDEGMSDREASFYADKMVRTSQGSGGEKDLANWQSPSSEAMRSLTLFYTIFNVQLNAQWEAVRNVKKGSYMKAAQLSFWFLVAAPLVDALLSGDMPDEDDDDDTWANWFGRNVFFNLFSGVPLVRDMASYGERKMAGQYATVGTTPVIRAEEAIKKAGGLAVTAAKGEELPDSTVKTMIETPGYFLGLPTGQAAATGQFLWDYSNGDTNPEGFSEWYRGLTKGKAKEDE